MNPQCIFAAEAVLKVVANGLVAHQGAYLRDSWNRLDGVIAVIGIVDEALAHLGGSSASVLHTVRVLRGLRPLRFLGRLAGMKVRGGGSRAHGCCPALRISRNQRRCAPAAAGGHQVLSAGDPWRH